MKGLKDLRDSFKKMVTNDATAMDNTNEVATAMDNQIPLKVEVTPIDRKSEPSTSSTGLTSGPSFSSLLICENPGDASVEEKAESTPSNAVTFQEYVFGSGKEDESKR